MYLTGAILQSDNVEIAPFFRQLRATQNALFEMFELEFIYGAPWPASDDAAKARVTVLTQPLSEMLFGSVNPVGKQVQFGSERFTIVGVVKNFAPKPKFYDLNQGALGDQDDAFIPFATAVDLSMTQMGNTSCFESPGDGWSAFVASECIWLQYWVELENATETAAYLSFLNAYADEQHKLGRFVDSTRNNHIVDVGHWLSHNKVVPQDSKIFVYVSIGFLLVCLINALGLMLAKFLRRTNELGVRRALGASKRSVFIQHLFEAGAIGAAGAALGVVLTLLGLKGMHLLYAKLENFAVLDFKTLAILVLISISATVLAGLLPAWRVSQLPPARALKAN
jgi:putative ABC transport system permease protein